MARASAYSRNSINRMKGSGAFWALLPFLLFLLAFEILPVYIMIEQSFRSLEGWTFSQYLDIFTNKFHLLSFKNTVYLAFFSSLVGMVVGTIGAYSLTRLSSKVRDRILLIANMTSNFAGVPLAFAFIVILGTNGLFTLLAKQVFHLPVEDLFNLYSWTGITLVYIYFQIPLAILLLYPAYYGIRPEWREGVESLGGGRWAYWRCVAIPILFPSIIGTFSILFANALGSYATAYALTSNSYNIVPLNISNLITGDVSLDGGLASALAVCLGIIMLTCIGINQWMLKRMRRDIG